MKLSVTKALLLHLLHSEGVSYVSFDCATRSHTRSRTHATTPQSSPSPCGSPLTAPPPARLLLNSRYEITFC
eukprot:88511-Pleurochrysis_carterae.AAC.9